jgi:hypothetical protein
MVLIVSAFTFGAALIVYMGYKIFKGYFSDIQKRNNRNVINTGKLWLDNFNIGVMVKELQDYKEEKYKIQNDLNWMQNQKDLEQNKMLFERTKKILSKKVDKILDLEKNDLDNFLANDIISVSKYNEELIEINEISDYAEEELEYINKNLKLIDQYQSKMESEQKLEDLRLDAEEKGLL